MTLLRATLATIAQALLLVALTVLACFAVGWCLGWVYRGFCATAGCP